MRSRLCSTLAVAGLALLTACAGPGPKIQPTAAQLSTVKTIAVVKPPEVKTHTVANLAHPGMAFGLIGGVIAAADQTSKEDRLTAAYRTQSLAVSERLAQRLADKLTALGYQATVEEGAWEDEKCNGNFTLAVDKLATTADAVLVATPSQ